jgi:ferrous-iron efflux pump FieF
MALSTHAHDAAGHRPAGRALDAAGDDERRLYRVMLWGYFTLFPLSAMFIVTAVLAHSSAVLVCSVLSAISITVQSFSIFALRQVLRGDTFRFPYGAGKLEDFAAFLCGVLFVPSGLFMVYEAAGRLVHPGDVRYLIGLVPVMLSAVRVACLYFAVRRLSRETRAPSPLLRAYLLDYRISLLNDLGIIVAFAVGWALTYGGAAAFGERVDPLIAAAISVYMVWSGVWLVRRNFRALVDLPLPEAEQLRVMKVLAAHYADYETVGTVYTRASGKRQYVEIELGFAGETTLRRIEDLSEAMEEELARELPGLTFRIVPVGS